jgi:hypothetical protein
MLLKILFGLMINSNAGYEVEVNTYTAHYFEPCEVADRFSNKKLDCGKGITNPIIGIKNINTRIFVGQNSVGSSMAGMTFSKKNFVLGGYVQDIKEFNLRGITPITVTKINTVGLTPIIGYELATKLYANYKIFSIITPVFATVGLGYRF